MNSQNTPAGAARYFVAAMKTAGLDPANQADVDKFQATVDKIMGGLNATQRQHLTPQRWKEYFDQAVDVIHNGQIMPIMGQFSNDTGHLWNLTEHGKAGQARRQQTQQAANQARSGDNFTPPGETSYRNSFTQDQGSQPDDKFKPINNPANPLPSNPSELWKMANKKGR